MQEGLPVMWIFGQVWFACLVGFAVGVLLDWVVRVRPLNERVADLEARLARSARQETRSAATEYAGSDFGSELGRRDVDRSGFGSLEADAFGSTGFGRDRTSAFATPEANSGSPSSDLLEDEPAPPKTEVVSGVEDYPGVARLNEAWAATEWEPEAAEKPAEPVTQTWQAEQPKDDWRDEPAESVTEVNGTAVPALPAQPSESESDEQYLNFLRSGTEQQQGVEQADDYATAPQANGFAQHDDGYAAQDDTGYESPQVDSYDTPQGDGYVYGADTERAADGVEEPDDTEVTSVLPYALDENGLERRPNDQDQQIDGQGQFNGQDQFDGHEQSTDQDPLLGQDQQQDAYQPFEGYQQDGYQQDVYQDGYQPIDYQGEMGYQPAGGYDNGGYQQDVVEPEESSSPLPHRGESTSPRYAPFEIPYGMLDSESGDTQPRSGELTPIQEGGFQPFAKPDDGDLEGLNGSNGIGHDDVWNGDTGFDPNDPMLVPRPPAANGASMLPGAGDDDEPSTWFDLNAPRDDQRVDSGGQGFGQVSTAGMTQRMLPVSTPDVDHPDLLGQSVFGEDGDLEYAPDGPSRSLFEPIIPSDDYDDGYGTQSAVPAPQAAQAAPSTDLMSDPMSDPMASAPRPVRVRTGMDGPSGTTFSGSALADAESQSQHQGVDVDDSQPDPDGSPAGPFGPGSALPLADGSAPSTQFRVKARTSSMVFHTESSPFYERLEPQVWFRDPQDAQRAGFTSWERPRSW
jgi:hypothetical protein